MKRFLMLFCFVALLLVSGQLPLVAQPPNVLMTLTGNNFTRQSVVVVGTVQFTPEYVSASTLRISIPRTMLSQAQPNNVRVVNPSAGGGSSAILPLVFTCKANNAVFANVSIVSMNYTFHQLDSAKYATPEYASTPISDDMRTQLRIQNRPYIKKSSITGKILNDGNVDFRFEDFQNNEPTDLPVADQVKYSLLKTATDSIEIYNGANELLLKAPAGSKPFKPIVDKVRAIRDAVQNLTQPVPASLGQPSSGQPSLGQPPPTSTALPPPALPSDTVIARLPILYEAWSMGFSVQKIRTSPYYRITLDKNVIVPNDFLASVRLAANEEMHILVNSITGVVEEIRTFRGSQTPKPLVHRIIQNYSFDANNRIVWKSKISYSYYDYEGLPLVFGSAEVFEEFKVTVVE